MSRTYAGSWTASLTIVVLFLTLRISSEPSFRLARINSLSQTLLKLTSPGVPDFYQGTELLDFSLVDPDNRRPVDYELRRSLLSGVECAKVDEIVKRPEEGLLNYG